MSEGSTGSGLNGATATDARAIVAIYVVGTLTPLVVAARFDEFLGLYVDPLTYSVLAGAAFGLAVWLLVDGLDLDRRTAAQAAIVGPTLVGGIVVPTLAYLALDPGAVTFRDEFIWYPLAITAGGGGAVGLSVLTERLSTRHAAVPDRRTVTVAVGTTALLGLGAVVGRRSTAAWREYTTPPDGEIEAVELEYHRWGVSVRPSLEVEPTPFQVTVVAPDGTVASERVTDDWDAPLVIGVSYPDGSIHRGRFEIRLESVRGVVVDTTSVTVEDGPIPSIRRVETRTIGRNSRIADVVVGNEGDARAAFDIALRGEDGERLDDDETGIDPGDETETVLTIHHDDREGTRDAVVTMQFDGPESDERTDRVELTFPDR